MKYQVPQFIEIEDKIVGPLTIKQFVYLAGGAGMCFITYNFLYLLLAIPLIAVIIALSLALAFYKVNNRNFIELLEAMFNFYTKDRLYIWKKEPKKIEQKEMAKTEPNQVYVPRMSDSKLKDLSWSLDINENMNPLTGDDGKNTREFLTNELDLSFSEHEYFSAEKFLKSRSADLAKSPKKTKFIRLWSQTYFLFDIIIPWRYLQKQHRILFPSKKSATVSLC